MNFYVVYPTLDLEEYKLNTKDGEIVDILLEFEKTIKSKEKEILEELNKKFETNFDDISFFNLGLKIYERIYPKASFEPEQVGEYNIRTVLIRKEDEKILFDLGCDFYDESDEYIKLVEEKVGEKLKVKFYLCPQDVELFKGIVLDQDIIDFLSEKFVKGRMLDVDIIIS